MNDPLTIGNIWYVAEAINRLCDDYGVPKGDDPLRIDCFQLHGRLARNGANILDVLDSCQSHLERHGYPRAA